MEKKHGFTIEAVSSGAILSTYQKNRVENICQRLNMKSLAYLWSRNQSDLLDEMINQGIHAILIKVLILSYFCSMNLLAGNEFIYRSLVWV